ncbi:EamA family transporter [Phyllobacterium brassicacearum]|uniref:EamA family transporter n=1 Tax=Phyllobacterium brassicacearum TaxID=314235 RepID=A0A2P7BT60_9HYPH|nr:DMT family transporter [Phyllobacterium brassicacearum]PSH69591.1 EamA family transporter [Phyllobacterium brassicacearum]TDQ30420.1 EamA-like transporter family protein [Phyllobacterium brassicacearum]
MTHGRANILLLAAGAIWGLGFVAQSSAMSSVGPFMFVAVRFLLAALTVLPFAVREEKNSHEKLTRSDYYGFFFIGVLLFSGAALQQIGIMTTSVTNSGFLTGLYVVMVPFLAVLLFWQWPHPVVWPCAMTALAGIYLLSGGQLDGLAIGDWLTVACAAFWALQIIFVNRIAIKSGRPIMLALVQFVVCGVLGLIIALGTERTEVFSVLAAAPEILFAGIFSSGIAFTLQAVGQRFTTAPQAAIMLSSEALFAALFGALILGERMSIQGAVGCALIFVAMIAVELVPALRSRADVRP